MYPIFYKDNNEKGQSLIPPYYHSDFKQNLSHTHVTLNNKVINHVHDFSPRFLFAASEFFFKKITIRELTIQHCYKNHLL